MSEELNTTPTPQDPIADKIKELSTKHNCTVNAFVLTSPGEPDAVCYVKEMSLQTELNLMDKMFVGQAFSAANDILETHLISESSDPRVNESNRKYWKAALRQIINNLETASVSAKKK